MLFFPVPSLGTEKQDVPEKNTDKHLNIGHNKQIWYQ